MWPISSVQGKPLMKGADNNSLGSDISMVSESVGAGTHSFLPAMWAKLVNIQIVYTLCLTLCLEHLGNYQVASLSTPVLYHTLLAFCLIAFLLFSKYFCGFISSSYYFSRLAELYLEVNTYLNGRVGQTTIKKILSQNFSKELWGSSFNMCNIPN